MTTENLIIFLLIGLVSGWLAGQVVKGYGFGVIGNILVGICGAFLGGYLFPRLGLNISGILGSIIYAFIGAVILLLIIRVFKRL